VSRATREELGEQVQEGMEGKVWVEVVVGKREGDKEG
jgi:hypothetical protein